MENKLESIDVIFYSKMSDSDACICDACHDGGKVIMIVLPKTKYYDGDKLKTKWEEYWLCEKCHKKLLRSIEDPDGV
jgi:hypothetical protein